MELIKRRFTFILKHNAWERFGSQALLIERLLGCSTGTELTPMLPRALTASPQHTSMCSSRATRSLFSWNRGLEPTTALPLFWRRASDAACPPRHPPPSSLKSKGAGLFNRCQEFFIQHGKGRVRREIQAVKTSVGSANRRSMMCFSGGRGAEKNESASSLMYASVCGGARVRTHKNASFPFLIRIYLLPFSQLFLER